MDKGFKQHKCICFNKRWKSTTIKQRTMENLTLSPFLNIFHFLKFPLFFYLLKMSYIQWLYWKLIQHVMFLFLLFPQYPLEMSLDFVNILVMYFSYSFNFCYFIYKLSVTPSIWKHIFLKNQNNIYWNNAEYNNFFFKIMPISL